MKQIHWHVYNMQRNFDGFHVSIHFIIHSSMTCQMQPNHIMNMTMQSDRLNATNFTLHQQANQKIVHSNASVCHRYVHVMNLRVWCTYT